MSIQLAIRNYSECIVSKRRHSLSTVTICIWCVNMDIILYKSRVCFGVLADLSMSHATLNLSTNFSWSLWDTPLHGATGVVPALYDPKARHHTKLGDAHEQLDDMAQQTYKAWISMIKVLVSNTAAPTHLRSLQHNVRHKSSPRREVTSQVPSRRWDRPATGTQLWLGR